MSSDPWSVQLEYYVDEPVHHDVLEDVERRMRSDPSGSRQTDVTQTEMHLAQYLVVVNTRLSPADPVEAGRQASELAERHLPAHGPLYRLTVWRYVV